MPSQPRWQPEDFARLVAALKESMRQDEISIADIDRAGDVTSGAIRHVLSGFHFKRDDIPESVKEMARVLGWPKGWATRVLDGEETGAPPVRHPVMGAPRYQKMSDPDRIVAALERADGVAQVQIEDFTNEEAIDLAARLLAMVTERTTKESNGLD